MRIETICQDYALTDDQADWLAGMVLQPVDLRREIAVRILERHGPDYLVEIFAQFVGMANSVLSNSQDFLEIAAIVEGGLSDRDAEKLNFPTLFGAVMGAKMAKFGCEKMCHGCAFRLGSHANQSPATTTDADWTGHPGEVAFMCHEGIDELAGDEPTKPCAGWIRLRQSRKTSASLSWE